MKTDETDETDETDQTETEACFLAATLHICPRSAIQYLLFHCLPTCYVGWCSSQLMRFTFQALDEPFLLEIVSNPEGGFLLFVVALSMVAVQPV